MPINNQINQQSVSKSFYMVVSILVVIFIERIFFILTMF
ncbi:hypothetical protein B4119_2406 [Parageobacillus caldoxylosilyticus]|uniref:Uncharacterized protein n=1 Tax=Saccharococcus caldoxylosilyticus TaxID=81408 RepID=A0A150LEL9_9BACL|nr:hypothetical protein B4119_2406 [Parageobacillus caldoxylosilyticus]